MIGNRRGVLSLEVVVVTTAVVTVLVGLAAYLKYTFQGRLKASIDPIGYQFSPEWSHFISTTTTHQRVKNTITPQGESTSELLDAAVTANKGYVDDFSGKKVSEEPLFR